MQVLIHHQLSLSDYPHITQFKEVFVTPRYLGAWARHAWMHGQLLLTV